MHSVRLTRATRRDLRKLASSVQTAIRNEIVKIARNPYADKKLQGSLRHLRSARLNHRAHTYRIAYEILEDIVVIEIVMVGKREGFYRKLERRLRGRS